MKRKMFLLSMVVLALFAFAPSAWSAGVLNVPVDPVHVAHSPWRGGTMGSTMNVTLSGIVGDYDVDNGTYPAWCIENHSHAVAVDKLYLYDSTGSLPAEFAVKRWDKVNYLLNNKNKIAGATPYDIQMALWTILGTVYGWGSSIDGLVDPGRLAAILADVEAAFPGDATFVPGPGQIVAVLIWNNGFKVCSTDDCQDTFFEVIVPRQGCTLTPGYWKTHSKYGPAPYDDTWAKKGEDTTFFKSGKSWYQVLWTPPRGGNAYYILSFQYIAAKLNLLAGAPTPLAVQSALTFAESFFNTYGPSDKLTRSFKNVVIYNAGVLDSYNNGYIGPGHCSD